MARFAEGTRVPKDRSRTEIEWLLEKHDCDNVTVSTSRTVVRIGFTANNRHVLMSVPIPPRDDEQFTMTQRGRKRPEYEADSLWRAEERRLWRSLLLNLKAKFDAIDSKLESFEVAFLAHIVLPGGRTVAQEVAPHIAMSYQKGVAVPLLAQQAGPDASGDGKTTPTTRVR